MSFFGNLFKETGKNFGNLFKETGKLVTGDKDAWKDLVTFGGATRENRANERGAQAAQAQQTAQQSYQSAYDKYRGGLQQDQNVYSKTMSGIDTQSKDAMAQYRNERDRLDAQADNTRRTLMGMESAMLDEAKNNVYGITNAYTSIAKNLSNQAAQQATDAKSTYMNTIKPNLMNNLSDAQNFQKTIQSQAMSLADSMDANNAVATQQREMYASLADQMQAQYSSEAQRMAGLYDAERAATEQRYADQQAAERADLEALMGRGTGIYGGEIEGTRQRGLADAGVLQALGAQSAGLMGSTGMPMTGSQMQAIMAQQGMQGSEAYAAAQRRIKDLEDQKRNYQLTALTTMGDRASDLRRMGIGKSDLIGSNSLAAQLGLATEGLGVSGRLRESGIEAGQRASDAAYERGYRGSTEAMDRTAKRLADLMVGETDYNTLAASLRGEQGAYAKDIFGADTAAERFRQEAADRQFMSNAAFQEGIINRGYGNTAQNLQMLQAGLGIDQGAAERLMGLSQNMNILDYQNAREQAGMAQDTAANQLIRADAQQRASVQELMGFLGLGIDAAKTAVKAAGQMA